MPISWNEIRHNAIGFARKWTGAKIKIDQEWRFWRDLFAVFGVRHRILTMFHLWADELVGSHDHTGLFWPGIMLVEQKTRGEDLDYTESQAQRCIADLVSAGRHDDVPRYVIASDLARISLLDLKPEDPIKNAVQGGYRIEFPLGSLHRHIRDFAFLLGNRQHHLEDQAPINLDARRAEGAAEASER